MSKFEVSEGKESSCQRFFIYGTGGVGKSSLVAAAKKEGVNPRFIDLENGTGRLNVRRTKGVNTFRDLIACLKELEGSDEKMVCVDTLSAFEPAIISYVLDTNRMKGGVAKNIEDYGYGKGNAYVAAAYQTLLKALNSLYQSGKHVVVIAHERVTTTPNPMGEDFLAYTPRLYAAGKFNAAALVKDWADEVWFVSQSFSVEDNKGKGCGDRVIYTEGRPTYWAKSRCIKESMISYREGDSKIWKTAL